MALLIDAGGRRLFRSDPRRLALVDRYALWSAVPLVAISLLFVAWPLAVAAMVVVPFAVLATKRFYFPTH